MLAPFGSEQIVEGGATPRDPPWRTPLSRRRLPARVAEGSRRLKLGLRNCHLMVLILAIDFAALLVMSSVRSAVCMPGSVAYELVASSEWDVVERPRPTMLAECEIV